MFRRKKPHIEGIHLKIEYYLQCLEEYTIAPSKLTRFTSYYEENDHERIFREVGKEGRQKRKRFSFLFTLNRQIGAQ